jgi:hypothetical protein
MIDDLSIKKILETTKTIAMVGVSSIKKDEKPTDIVRRPSNIVMKYLLEFGYKVIPINPYSKENTINGERVFANLDEVSEPIDMVNIFRPSIETPDIARQAIKIGIKTLWLQYGIQNEETQKISSESKVKYVYNRCIKQEYQRLFLKTNPVFPALKS